MVTVAKGHGLQVQAQALFQGIRLRPPLVQPLQVDGNNMNAMGHGNGEHHQRPHIGNLVKGKTRPTHRTQVRKIARKETTSVHRA